MTFRVSLPQTIGRATVQARGPFIVAKLLSLEQLEGSQSLFGRDLMDQMMIQNDVEMNEDRWPLMQSE